MAIGHKPCPGTETKFLLLTPGCCEGPNSSMWSISSPFAPVIPLSAQRLADRPGKVRQSFHIVEREFVIVGLDQKKPVSAPCNIAAYRSKAGNIDCDLRRAAIARDIIYRHFSAVVEDGAYRTHRSLDAMLARLDAAHVGERRDQSNGAVPAHAQVSHIVEEDHAGGAARIHRFTQQSADHHV